MKTPYITPISHNRRNLFRVFLPFSKKPKSTSPEELHLARQYVLQIHNALASKLSKDSTSFDLSGSKTGTAYVLLEEIAQNISKIDQNLYCTKNNVEETLRSSKNNSTPHDIVSLN